MTRGYRAMDQRKGTDLSAQDQARALARYVQRFTRDHVPDWAAQAAREGRHVVVEFDSDDEWLANTLFSVRADGGLDGRARYCESTPTWPDGHSVTE
jgi:hypothetical protein